MVGYASGPNMKNRQGIVSFSNGGGCAFVSVFESLPPHAYVATWLLNSVCIQPFVCVCGGEFVQAWTFLYKRNMWNELSETPERSGVKVRFVCCPPSPCQPPAPFCLLLASVQLEGCFVLCVWEWLRRCKVLFLRFINRLSRASNELLPQNASFLSRTQFG